MKGMRYTRLMIITRYMMMYDTWMIRSYIEQKKMIPSRQARNSRVIVPLQVITFPHFSNVPRVLGYGLVRWEGASY